MTDQHRLDMIDWHKECAGLLTAGIDRVPPKPVELPPTEHDSGSED